MNFFFSFIYFNYFLINEMLTYKYDHIRARQEILDTIQFKF